MNVMMVPKRWPMYLTVIAAAFIIALGAFFGLKRGGEAVAARLPDVPSASELLSAVPASEPYERISPAIVENIRTLAELTTVEYVESTIIEKGTDGSWLRWARGDGITLFAVAEIGAGVDLAKLDDSSFTVDSTSGLVTITLPAAEILYSSLDNTETTVFERSTGIFTQGDEQLETEARILAESTMLEKAIDEGILEQAQRNAEQVLSQFIKSLGYPRVEFAPVAAASTSG